MSRPLTFKNLNTTEWVTITLRTSTSYSASEEYQVNFGDGWKWFPLDSDVGIAPNVSFSLRIKEPQNRGSGDYVYFDIGGPMSVSGNVNSMITPDFEGLTDISAYPYALRALFVDCTQLKDVSKLEFPATKLSKQCYDSMFAYSSVKVSEVLVDKYIKPFRIPTQKTGTIAEQALRDMFLATGGTFTGTPEINKTYYLYTEREDEGIYHYTGSSWKLDGDANKKATKIYYQKEEPENAKDGDYWAYKD